MSWQELFEKWIDRLIPGWHVNLVADESIDARADCCVLPANRKATIRWRPDLPPSDRTACHEVCHCLAAHMQIAAENIADALPEPAKIIANDRIAHESEETAELLTDAFLKAYGETGI